MNSRDTLSKRVVHIDEKSMQPRDKVGSGVVTLKDSEATLDENIIKRPAAFKSVIGRPKVYDLKGNLLASEENLVVITGREYLAQLLAGTQGHNPEDYTNYKVTHFGVGDGGTVTEIGGQSCSITTTGPFDNDEDLENRVVIKDPIAGGQYPNYVDDGKLKRIEADGGSITVLSEQHTINVAGENGSGQMVIDAYTAVRYVMYLKPNEPKDKPFRFNEAGLYSVKYEWDENDHLWKPTDDYILFARFTTLDKYLEAADGIMIEWYVLV
jgi:hypothetical protein